MKSQVNALLHVLQGLIKDAQAAYPELRDDLTKDYGRIALVVKDRGLGVFTLDLPSLESLLLKGLEHGRLVLEGPLSTAVSKRVRVPRLYAGLWLRVFDKDSCLKREVDATAVAFLRQLLCLGKKLRVECSYNRTQSVVGAYHGIEHQLRRPSLNWLGDDLGVDWDRGDCSNSCSSRCNRTFELPLEEEAKKGSARAPRQSIDGSGLVRLESLHLVQALDGSPDFVDHTLPLFGALPLAEEQLATRLEDQFLLSKIQQVADLIIGSFDHLNPVFESSERESDGRGIGFKHGPGAVAEKRKNWEKSHFPNWPRKLEGFFPYDYCGNIATFRHEERPPHHEVASRLIAVPKTYKGPRLIAAEPTSHQWCQQLLLGFLFDQCRARFGSDFIDFRDQSKSGDLVLRASLTRELATVDLSDASDRLSCWTVERVFRSNSSILHALHAARTRYLRDEVSEELGFLSLRKFASQGTATTFPVMSLVMLCIAFGSILKEDELVTYETLRKYRDQVRVFGDDIILPSHGYERLLRAMTLLQLKINVAKSYVLGHFRESCGTDGYSGYDVTPVRPEVLVADSPASCQAVVDTTNNLLMKGYWHASAACYSLIPVRLRRRIRIVGPHDTGFRGVTSFSGGDERHLVTRWNARLHRHEVRVWSIFGQTTRHQRNGRSALLDFFASKHSTEQARSVSEYADVRKTKGGLQWEPSNYHSRVHARREPERRS